MNECELKMITIEDSSFPYIDYFLFFIIFFFFDVSRMVMYEWMMMMMMIILYKLTTVHYRQKLQISLHTHTPCLIIIRNDVVLNQ